MRKICRNSLLDKRELKNNQSSEHTSSENMSDYKDIEKSEDANPGSYRLRQDLINFMCGQIYKRHPDTAFSPNEMQSRINGWLCDHHHFVIEFNQYLKDFVQQDKPQ
jgi:hypothetical protein